MRKAMVEGAHPQLSTRAQCELLGVNRNRLVGKPRPKWEPEPEHVEMMELMKLAHRKDPTMGTRRLGKILLRNGYPVARWTVRQMMRFLGLWAIYRRPRTSVPSPEHPKYPYLVGQRTVSKPDEVWATDITYIPWGKGHVYLVAILDWHTRAVLGWRLSNTMDVRFCLDALGDAISVAGCVPEILNTDQGSQFTGVEWLSAVESLGNRVREVARILTPPNQPRTIGEVAERLIGNGYTFKSLTSNLGRPRSEHQPEWFEPCVKIDEGFDYGRFGWIAVVPATDGERKQSPRGSFYVFDGMHKTLVLAKRLLKKETAFQCIGALYLVRRRN